MKFWQGIAFTETDQLADIAALAEDLGFTGLSLSEHLVTPARIESLYPYTPDGKIFWDPAIHWFDNMVLAATLAARTTRLQFVNAVVILPLRDPFTMAKSVASAAYLSGNRIVLGVGAGWMKEEFDLTGQRFTDRGRRMDEMIEVMRLLWSGEMVEYHGRFYDFEPVQMSPATSAPVPVVVGGHADAALRRAARNDGWFGAEPYAIEDLLPILDVLARYRHESDRSMDDFEILIALNQTPTVDALKRLRDRGVTGHVSVPWLYQGMPSSTIDQKRATMERIAEELIAPLQGS